MDINSIAPWFGAKRTLAARIVAELGPHSAYWEPFCGSMAVLFAKEPCAMETVNDLHGDLVNLGRVVAHEELHRVLFKKLRRTFASAELMNDAAARWKSRGNVPAGSVPDLDRAYDYFLSTWLGRNGVAGTQSYNQGYSRRFTKSGGHAARRWCSAVDSIPVWCLRLREVSILSDDAFGMLERIEDANGVVIYLDPPYFEKGARYIHDADDDWPAVSRILGIDVAALPPFAWHRALAKLVNRFKKTRVLISYYDHPLLAELYPSWTKLDFSVTKALCNQGMRGQRLAETRGPLKAPEVLLINGPSLSVKSLF